MDQPTGLSCRNTESVTTFSKPLIDEHPHCLSPKCCEALLEELKDKVWRANLVLVVDDEMRYDDEVVERDKKKLKKVEEALEDGKAYHEACKSEQALQPE
jgi:hypothetical protein